MTGNSFMAWKDTQLCSVPSATFSSIRLAQLHTRTHIHTNTNTHYGRKTGIKISKYTFNRSPFAEKDWNYLGFI